MNLNKRNIVVYDMEIKNSIGSKFGEKTITWNDHDLMGISVACLYDYRDGDFKVYMDDNISELGERLRNADMVVGFNIIGFDNKLGRAMDPGFPDDKDMKIFDIYDNSRRAAGWKEGVPHLKNMSLDEHLKGTFGPSYMKTQNGADAPKFYQQKLFGKLTSYCLADVRREKLMFEYVVRYGKVKLPAYGEIKCAINWAKYPEAMAQAQQ